MVIQKIHHLFIILKLQVEVLQQQDQKMQQELVMVGVIVIMMVIHQKLII